MTDEVKQEAADYYKSMFETACREAVKRCGEAEENGSKAPRRMISVKPAMFCWCWMRSALLFFGTFGAGGYSGFSGSQTSESGSCDDGSETAGGAAFAG